MTPGAGNADPSGKGDPPLVTIVTPSYNQAEFLEETIRSVLEQDYPRIEYIVMDGGSTDGSLEILRRYEDRLSYWTSAPDLGQTDAINKGFALAKGEILAWLNSDDTYRPGAVSEAVDFLRSHPEVGMVYGVAYYVDAGGKILGRFPMGQISYRSLRRGANTIAQQAAFFRASVWRLVGPLDPSFYYAMDWDLWVRIAAVTPIVFHPRPWANFRLHGGSKSLTAASRCWPEMIRVHFRRGGSVFSVIYAKYLLRRLLEPIMPLRMRARFLQYRLETRLGRRW
jgi:glycosyltransferase involved in cell wall biosynthesis